MALIKIEGFSGIAPRIDPKKLPEGGAQHAVDVIFEGGDLCPLRSDKPAQWPGGNPPAIARTIHPWGSRWLAWLGEANVVNTPVVQDQWKRIYWTTGGPNDYPKFEVGDQLQGNFVMDGIGKRLGVIRPSRSPSVRSTAIAAEEQEVRAHQLSQTTPVRVVTADDHPFADGQRVIVVMERSPNAAPEVPETPPERTGMVEIVGKTYTIKTIGVGATGVVNRREFSLIGADGSNFSQYDPNRWVAKVKRVFSDSDKDSRSYVCTFVSNYGEESQPSDPSDIVDVLKSSKVTVDVLGITGEHISAGYKVRLYRSVTGASGTQFFFVKEKRCAANLSIEDDVKPEAIGEVLPSAGWAPPVAGMSGLVAMPGGFLAAFRGNTIYFSEPYMPHAWPDAYRRTTQDEIVGLGVYGQTLVVATRGKPYLASGADPASVSLQQLDDHAPCMSGRCLTATGTGVIYPTQDGLVHVSSGGVRRLTQGYFTREQWESFFRDPVCAIWHGGRYIASADGKLLLFQPEGKGVHISVSNRSRVTAMGVARHSDMGAGGVPEDTLYFAVGPSLVAFARGDRVDSAEWAGKVFSLPHPVSLACGQVIASSYPVSIVIHAALPAPNLSGQPPSLAYPADLRVHRQEVSGPEPFRLPSGFLAREWRVDVETRSRVQAIYLASSMAEIRQI